MRPINLIFSEISTEKTFHLRQKILRPHQSLADMRYPQDAHPRRRHFAMKQDQTVVAIASFYPESLAGVESSDPWRLRGMAVDTSMQSQGLGKLLLTQALAKLRHEEGVTLIWCHARISALSFYLALGFQTLGETFLIEPIGPHKIAYLGLSDRPRPLFSPRGFKD